MHSKAKIAILVAPIVILATSTAVFIVSIAHWDYPTVIGAMSPWLTLFGPTLAAGLVYIGWTRTHKDASTRDFDNWRRNALLKHVSELIALSTRRNRLLLDMADSIPMGGGKKRPLDTDTDSQVLDMLTIVEQMNLLDKSISKAGSVIQKLHEKANESEPNNPDLYEAISCQIVDTKTLETAHEVLRGVFDNQLDDRDPQKSLEYNAVVKQLEMDNRI